MTRIEQAHTGDALAALLVLAQTYVDWMLAEIPQHYPELDRVSFAREHGYDNIRAKFPGTNVPPRGALWVAYQEAEAVACLGLGPLTQTVAELRALYVLPQARGAGIGRALVRTALDHARATGYEAVRLDTLGFMSGAQRLYASFGFQPIAPYLDIPAALQPYIRFMELRLSDAPAMPQ